jgi:hypothetical protein
MKLKLNNKDYTIKKLPLGKYAELLEKLDELPEEITTLNENELVKALPRLIGKFYPRLLEILSLASNIDSKTLSEEMGLVEATEIIKAIFQVNDFALVKKNIASLGGGKKKTG